MLIKSVGLPRMNKEKGEKRDFLPEFVKKLDKYPVDVVLEEGYGSKMEISPDKYLEYNPRARFGSFEEVYNQDLIIVLRSPDLEEIDLMKEHSVLMSMLHYETRPLRIKKLKEKNILGLSLDGIINDNHDRIVENLAGTSWNGIKTAFEELAKIMPDFFSKDRNPITVSIIGIGAVGLHAARAASKYGNLELYKSMEDKKKPGVLVQFFPKSITRDKSSLKNLLKSTDIIVDASKRYDPTKSIILNDLIGLLPEHAVILDLTADPYNLDLKPIQVKGIEGIPTGTLNQYIFYPEDKAYNNISKFVNTSYRRIVASCNAWPGIIPAECMDTYGKQISRFFPTLFSKSPEELSLDADSFYERALARSTVEYFENYILPDSGNH